MKMSLCVVAAVLLASGCRSNEIAQPLPLPVAPSDSSDSHLIVADSSLTIEGDTFYQVNIPYQFVNTTDIVLANEGCHPPTPPQLQWWTGTAWRDAYDQIFLLCLSAPLLIDPQTTFSGKLVVGVFRDSIGSTGHGQEPHWLGPRAEADYRVLWTTCEYRGGNGPMYTCTNATLQTSAPFRMRFAGK